MSLGGGVDERAQIACFVSFVGEFRVEGGKSWRRHANNGLNSKASFSSGHVGLAEVSEKKSRATPIAGAE
jgi:hypothetical protein